MVRRSKRLKEGVKSLEQQIQKHKQKLEEARKQKRQDLTGYYEKEIQKFQQEIEKKKRQLGRRVH